MYARAFEYRCLEGDSSFLASMSFEGIGMSLSDELQRC